MENENGGNNNCLDSKKCLSKMYADMSRAVGRCQRAPFSGLGAALPVQQYSSRKVEAMSPFTM